MSDVAPAAEDRKTFRLLGAVSLLLGILSITRIAVELYQTRTMTVVADYFLRLAYDFLLALAACLGGVGLLRDLRRATASITLTATALFVTSAMMLINYGHTCLSLLLELGMQRLPISVVLTSRLLLAGIHAIYWPIVAGHIYIELQCRDPNDPSTRTAKRRFWWRLGAAGLACAGVELLLRLAAPSQVID
jgi:hypothetical protein